MFNSLINILSSSLYRERDFVISKIDDTHFFVKARNGLNANVIIHDRIMFVDTSFEYETPFTRSSAYLVDNTFSKSKPSVVRYSTQINESLLSFDDFVVESIKNTILFKIEKNRLSSYFKEYEDFFKDVLPVSLYHKLISADLDVIRFLNYDDYVEDGDTPEPDCFYEYIFFDKKYYPIIHFHKKKVIKNIFKYTFHAKLGKKIKPMAKKETVIAYYIDGVFFNLCDLKTFFFDKAIKDKSSGFNFGSMKFNFNPYTIPDPKILYGINNQLFDHQSFLSKHIDVTKVLVLRRDGQQYCLFKRKNRKITLSYITDFGMENTFLASVFTYSLLSKKILSNEETLSRYKNESLITYSYLDGKLTKKTERVDFDMVSNHEMEISNQVIANSAYLKAHYPSEFIVKRLNDFGICTDIPISLDNLSLLEMCEI